MSIYMLDIVDRHFISSHSVQFANCLVQIYSVQPVLRGVTFIYMTDKVSREGILLFSSFIFQFQGNM